MTFTTLIARYIARHRVRTLLTISAIAVAVMTFLLLRTIIDAWHASANSAATDRLSTRHKHSYGLPLPKHYADDIRTHIAGIRSVTYCDWFGGHWAKDPSLFFANLACADNAFDVYPEISIDAAQLARWKADRQGAVIGRTLAKTLGLALGDKLTLQGTFYPGDWELTIDGIYSVPAHSTLDSSSLFFRWEYKNDGVAERDKNMIGWIFTRVDDAADAARISRAIDALFDERGVQTLSMSERAANHALLGGISSVLAALNVISAIVLAIIALIVGNTFAMNARARRSEYAMLRVLGFEPRQIRRLLMIEALCVACLGYCAGVALAFPIVQVGIGRWLEENAGKFFPRFVLTPNALMTALTLSLLAAAVAAWLPATSAVRGPIQDALRKPM